jgi:hypothetical protein
MKPVICSLYVLLLIVISAPAFAQSDTVGYITIDGALLDHSSSWEAIGRLGIGLEFSDWRVGGSYASAAEITPKPTDAGTTEFSEWMVFGLRRLQTGLVHLRAGIGLGSFDMWSGGGFSTVTIQRGGAFADLIAEAGVEGRHLAIGLAYHRRLSKYSPDDIVGMYLRFKIAGSVAHNVDNFM